MKIATAFVLRTRVLRTFEITEDGRGSDTIWLELSASMLAYTVPVSQDVKS